MNVTPHRSPHTSIEIIKPTVRLIGQNGNSVVLIGLCLQEARRQGWTNEQCEAFKAEATSGNREHVLNTIMLNFKIT